MLYTISRSSILRLHSISFCYIPLFLLFYQVLSVLLFTLFIISVSTPCYIPYSVLPFTFRFIPLHSVILIILPSPFRTSVHSVYHFRFYPCLLSTLQIPAPLAYALLFPDLHYLVTSPMPTPYDSSPNPYATTFYLTIPHHTCTTWFPMAQFRASPSLHSIKGSRTCSYVPSL